MRIALALAGFVCLVAVTFGRAVPVSARTQGAPPEVTEGRLEAVGPDGAPRGTCPLEHTDVRAEISGFLARVTVTQRFANPFDEPIEAVYLFPLPDEAAVDGMTMRIGDRVIRGEIKERGEARAVYERARAEGKVASLLEQQRPNVFTQSVANIVPGAAIEVVITYVETLSYEDGSYHFVFPMVVGKRYVPGSMAGEAAARIETPAAVGRRAGHDVSLEVSIDAGVPIEQISSTLHEVEVERPSPSEAVVRLASRDEIPNRDFILDYKVAGGKIEDALLAHRDERGGFFTLILQPPDRVASEDVTPKELVFVLDTSGSMSGFPIEKAKECIGLALDGLYPDDTFNLITFAGNTSILFPEPVPATRANLAKAKKFLESSSGGGGTEMMTAIRAALEPTDRQDHVRVVCFMTDGMVGNDMGIVSEIQKHPNARVFSFGIGDSVNRFLLDKMAEEGKGEVEYVTLQDDGSAAARRFHERVRSPLLVDVSIDWGDLKVTDVYPARIPDLFGAKPVVVCGRYDAPAEGVVHLRGRAAGREVVRDVHVSLPAAEPRHDVLATLWARRRVDDLMRQDYAGIESGTPKEEIRKGIVDLGVAFRLVTQFTSFVAVEERPVTAGGDPRSVGVEAEVPAGVDAAGAGYGGLAESVTVVSAAVQTLPLAARGSYSLVEVSAGPDLVQPCASAPTRQPAPNPAVSPDGVDANQAVPVGLPGEAAKETGVWYDGYTAEYGAASSIVKVVTKSGTNDFHGSVYEFNRTSATASQPFAEKAIASPAPVPEGVFARNQFGFTIGGPVVRDRLFFFGAAEFLRVRSTRNAPFLVPTPELLAASGPATRAFFGDAALRPGIDARTVRVGDVPFADRGPFSALGASFPAFFERYVVVCGDTGAGVAQNTAQATVRADWKASDLTHLTARYGLDRSTLFPGSISVSPYAGFDTGARLANDAVEVTIERVVSPVLVVEGSFAFNRRDERRPLADGPAAASLYLLPRPFVPLGNGTAAVALPGYAPLMPGEGLPSAGPRSDVRLSGKALWAVGSHSLDLGGAWSRVFDDRDGDAYRQAVETLGRTTPAALDNLVLGRALRIEAVASAGGSFARAVRYDEAGIYASDSWHLTPHVTLNLGVRYDVFGVPHDAVSGRDANLYEGTGATVAEQLAAGVVGPATGGLYAADRNNWAPRLSVAWDVFGDGQTILRGGYGIVYGRVADRAGAGAFQNAPSLAVGQVYAADLGLDALPISRDGAEAAGGPVQVRAVDVGLRNPYTRFWSLSVAREMRNTVVSVDYAGVQGVGLASLDNVNRPFSGVAALGLVPTPANPLGRLNARYGDIWQLRNSGSSSSNGLSVGVERRSYSAGLQISARYTWAHAIDDVGTEGPFYGFSPGLLDPFDPRLDRGDADTDVRHRFITRGAWDMPFGGNKDGWRRRLLGEWAASWVFEARTGTPFTIYDCTNALSSCIRLLEVGPIADAGEPVASRLAADAGTGNRYVYLDLAGQLAGRGAFVNPLSGTSDVGPFPSNMTARNAFRGPGAWNFDAGITRTIAFNEALRLELRVEAFNVFNHANLFVSRGEADVSASAYVPAFFDGRRQIQFGARLSF